jgi:type IV secretion system protein VirD4
VYTIARLKLVLAVALFVYCLALAALLAELAFGPWAWAALAVVAVLVLRSRKARGALTACGSAAWAKASELLRAGCLTARSGLILGRVADDSRSPAARAVRALLSPRLGAAHACREFFDAASPRRRRLGRLVRLPQAVHTMVVAPTGVGKSTAFAIPFLLTEEESAVVVDFKGEIISATAAQRRRMGHRVVALDPFRVVTAPGRRPDTFNALDFIDPGDPLALDQVRAFSEELVVRTGEEKELHWLDSAEAVIGGVAATVALYGRKDRGTRSLGAVRDVLSDPARWDLAKRLMQEHGGILGRWGGQLGHFRGDELASVLTTANRFLRFLDSPAVAESTAGSSFDPADLRRRRMTVYLVLPPEHIRTQVSLLRTWVGGMVRAAIRGGTRQAGRVHLVLDEAAALGHLPVLDDALTLGRAYGLRLQFYYQSLGQLQKIYPHDKGQNLLSNTTKVFFGTNDLQTAQFVSQSLGQGTIAVEGGGSNSGWSRQWSSSSGASHSEGTSRSYSAGSTSSWQQQGRDLLKADELMTLSPRVAVTLTPGLRPIATTLVRHYEEPALFWRPAWWRRGFDAARTLTAAALLLAAAGGGAWVLTAALDAARNRPVRQPPFFGPVPPPDVAPGDGWGGEGFSQPPAGGPRRPAPGGPRGGRGR